MKNCNVDGCDRPSRKLGMCTKHYDRAWGRKNPKEHVAQVHKWRLNHPEWTMLSGARCRARKYGLAFNIEVSDICIPKTCPILGIELKKGLGRISEASPSIDRIRPERGYVKGHIVVISNRANRIKNDATLEEITKLQRWMTKQLKNS
jgi:hypothetical protein